MSDFTHERWLPVVGWEGLYEVSDLGRVKSLHKAPRILKPSYSNTGGYALVILYNAGRRSGRYVHDLMMEAFVGPRPDGPRIEVRHLDDNPAHNVLSNLTYGTSKDNKADMLRNSGHHYGNRDACVHGHEFTPENTRINTRPDGAFLSRVCRKCHNDETKARRVLREASGPLCSEPGCDRHQSAKGLCGRHYQQQWSAAKRAKQI